MKNKIFIMSILAIVISTSVYAQKSLPIPKIKSDEFVIIGKVLIDFDYDAEYMRKALNVPKSKKVLNKYRIMKHIDKSYYDGDIHDSNTTLNENGSYFTTIYTNWHKQRYDNWCLIWENKFFLFDYIYAYITLPFDLRFSPPRNAKYIYVGTFYIKLDPVTSKIIETKHIDEYEQAKEWLQEQKGTDAELVRVELEPIPKKD